MPPSGHRGPLASSLPLPRCRPSGHHGPLASLLPPRLVVPPLRCRGPSRCLGPFRVALRIVIAPFTSWLGLTRCGWALRVVVGPYVSWLGPTHRGWALRVVVGPYASWLGPTRHGWALLLSSGPSRCCRALRGVVGYHSVLCVVVWPYVGRWTLRVVVRPFAWSLGPLCGRLLLSWGLRSWRGPPCWQLDEGGQWRRGKRENGPRQKSWPVFMAHRVGLPFHGSPLVFLPPVPPVE